MQRVGQRGDTIVEVMIVLAVLGLAIGITYSTATKSLYAVRAAQESAKASGYLQSQVELLRSLSARGDNATATAAGKNIFQATTFCINNRDTTNIVIKNIIGADAKDGNNPCYLDNLYSIKIERLGNTFNLSANWSDVSGEGDEDSNSAKLSYRIYTPK